MLYRAGGLLAPTLTVLPDTHRSQTGVQARPVLPQSHSVPEHTTHALPGGHSASELHVVVEAKVPHTVPPPTRVQQKQSKGVGSSGQSTTLAPWHVVEPGSGHPQPSRAEAAAAGEKDDITGTAQTAAPTIPVRLSSERRSMPVI
jgi:hypothetical protein